MFYKRNAAEVCSAVSMLALVGPNRLVHSTVSSSVYQLATRCRRASKGNAMKGAKQGWSVCRYLYYYLWLFFEILESSFLSDLTFATMFLTGLKRAASRAGVATVCTAAASTPLKMVVVLGSARKKRIGRPAIFVACDNDLVFISSFIFYGAKSEC